MSAGGDERVVGRLGIGCVKLGNVRATHGRRRAVRLVREAVDTGVTFFDTADVYSSGRSEAVLGDALRGRDGVEVATKVGYVFDEALGTVATITEMLRRRPAYSRQDFSAAYIRRAAESSLRRLRRERIDVLQLHGPPSVCHDDVLAVLDDLVRSGKVGRVGVGLETIEQAAGWLDEVRIDAAQCPFGMLDPEASATLIPALRRQGRTVIARGVLASGLLDATEASIGVHFDARKYAHLVALRSIAAEAGITPQRLALGWVLDRDDVDVTLVGLSSTAHLRAILADRERRPAADALRRVDAEVAAYLADRAVT